MSSMLLLTGRLLIAGFVVAALGGCAGSERARHGPPSQREVSRALQRILDDARGETKVGVSAAVVERGRVRWSGGSGVGDLRAARPVTGDSVYGVASLTKTFVAALTLRLAEQGDLELDDPVSKWVPRARVAPEITLRSLLNHTSGLFGIDENPVYSRAVDRAPRRRWTPEETLRYVRRPYFPPGRGWHYSDTNYVLAGLAIERATGSRVGSQMRTLLLEPHALDRTGLQPQDHPPPDAAHGHGDPAQTGTIRDLTRGMRWVPYDSLASSEWTSGGMYATAEEVARFGDALFTGRVVKRAALDEMTKWVSATMHPYIGYGLGIGQRFVRDLGGELWGSIGRVPGFEADLWHVPSRGITVAVLTNDERIDPTEIADAVLRETIHQR
jgi:D-alanyl-D-alanine carboxypeptidase